MVRASGARFGVGEKEMAREKKSNYSSSFGFSWADEVEREEQQHKDDDVSASLHGTKPNPFGAARPREVVLAEKGVDWRRIDLELDQHSNLRKDKLKENISAATGSCSRRQEHSSIGPRCPDRNKPEAPSARNFIVEQHKQNTRPLIPPLKYPSKNLVALMPDPRRGHIARFDAGIDYPHENIRPVNLGMEYVNLHSSTGKIHADGLMNHRQLGIGHGVMMPANHNYIMERAGHGRHIDPYTGIGAMQEVEFRCKRKLYGERVIGATEEMRTHWENIEGPGFRNYGQERRFTGESGEQQANGRRRILVDHCLGRSGLEKEYTDGDQYYREYNEYGRGWRNYDQQPVSQSVEPLGLIHGQHYYDVDRISGVHSTGEVMHSHGARRVPVSMEGASSGPKFNKKSKVPLSSNHPRRKGKQKKK